MLSFVLKYLGSLKESELKEITLHVEDEKAFSEVLDYFYTSKVEIKESNVQDLIPIAGMLQLKRLQQACCEFMKRNISPLNCLGKFLIEIHQYMTKIIPMINKNQ